MKIPVLTYRAAPQGYHRSAIYNGASGGLPWFRELQSQANQELAWAEAVTWARDYAARDPYGNMAQAVGVVAFNGQWRGVVNYYHSNT